MNSSISVPKLNDITDQSYLDFLKKLTIEKMEFLTKFPMFKHV